MSAQPPDPAQPAPRPGPLQRYQAEVASGHLALDPEQLRAAEALQDLTDRLGRLTDVRSEGGFFTFWKREPDPDATRGIYLWGGVGRGKSMLMDMFFAELPLKRKHRAHFHEFMQKVHDGIRAARETGTTDPIAPVAAAFAKRAQVLCLDEMQVKDITDAMILGRLFEALFAHNVVLVTTSNRPPTDLYKNGLNRKLFLPFIDMIGERLKVIELDSGTDYRLEDLQPTEVYQTPLGAEADAVLDAIWERLTGGAHGRAEVLRVQGRDVVLRRSHERIARSSFADLCARPLGASDYLVIAERFDTLILDRVPVLAKAKANEAARFIKLVDALYEFRCKLVVSAAAPPDELYTEGEGAFEFQRTASRLMEMQGEAWLQQETAP